MDNYYNGISKGYDELHGDEQRKKLSLIKRYFNPKRGRVLDIGCGTGLSSEFDCFVVGLDQNLELLKQNIRPKVLGRGEALPFKDKSFDHCICLTAVHHMDVDKLIGEIKRVVKGKVIISILKKSKNKQIIFDKLIINFKIIKEVKEEKDIILILSLE
jgi:ubiquinone/menaquinone biosynthesis C-methylase UbiE